MNKLAKILLALAIGNLVLGLLFAAGVIQTGKSPDLFVALPVGATFFGLFMITRLMAKEAASFDADKNARH